MKIYENGIYRDMTAEEVAEFEKQSADPFVVFVNHG